MLILKRPSLVLLLLLIAFSTATTKGPTADSFKITAPTFVFACSDILEFVARTDDEIACFFLQGRYIFLVPGQIPMEKTGRTTRYQAQESGHELLLTISGEVCLDSMSGGKFDSKATVNLDGKTLQGSGRVLH